MLRIVVTLILTLGALFLAMTTRGLALLGPRRPILVFALGILGILQAYRLFTAWQKYKRRDRLSGVPKRPLGI